MTSCPHGMPTPGSCIDCMDEGNLPSPPPAAPIVVVASFPARFEGYCTGCNLPIRIREQIVTLSTGAYVHEGCEP